MPTLNVEFPGSQGTPLAARLDLPSAPPRAYALFAHCFTCSKESRAAAYVGRALADAGIALLRFDFTGLGDSAGEFAETTYSSNVADLTAAADWLRREHAAPGLLIGHSLGGAAVIAAAADIPEVRAVVTLNAPADPRHVLQHIDDAATGDGDADATVQIEGRPFRVKRSFLADVEEQRQSDRIRALGRALLVMHAPADTVVGIDQATAIYTTARHPKSFVSLDGADHLLTDRGHARWAAGVMAAWAARYLDDAAQEPGDVPEGAVRSTERGTGKFAVRVETAAHAIHADEPARYGGDDGGMSPYELLSAALGTCTVMTLRMYADRKQLPLARASATVVHSKVHAVDCAECETRDAKIDRLERTLVLEGDLSDEQRARLLEIADRCPVHRTLEGHIEVVTHAGEAPAGD